MEAPKEINIEVKDFLDYDERVIESRLICFLFNLVLYFLLIATSKGSFEYKLTHIIIFVSYGITDYNIRLKNRCFIHKLHVDKERIFIFYRVKNDPIIKCLQGNSSEFDISSRLAQWTGKNTILPYISIKFKGKNVIKQFGIGGWRKYDLEQIVKDINNIQNVAFWVHPVTKFFRSIADYLSPKLR